MRATKLLPPLFAGLTVALLVSNAVPAMLRKRRLQEEQERLEHRYRSECLHGGRLRAELDALQNDPFVLQRWYLETWKSTPEGAVSWEEFCRERDEGDSTGLEE